VSICNSGKYKGMTEYVLDLCERMTKQMVLMMQFSNNDVDKVKNLLSSIDFTINTVGQNNEVLVDRVVLGIHLFLFIVLDGL
jgi:hypothetical protein